MAKMFHPEGKFAHYGGKIADLMWLNVLVVLCSLPVITAGTATTAMHYVLLRIHRDEEYKVTRTFLKSFRENLRQGTAIFCIFAAAVYLLLAGIQIPFSQQTKEIGIIRYLIPVVLAVVMCICNWALVLQSRYRNLVMGTVRLALTVCLAYPLRSAAMLIIALLPVALLLIAVENLIIVLMAGFTLTGILQTCLYSGVFHKLETGDAQKENGDGAKEQAE